MGYFQVRYDSRVVNYKRRGFIRLVTEADVNTNIWVKHSDWLREVTWLVTSNQRALFQRGIDTLLWNLCVTLAPQDPGFESNHWQLSLNIKWIKKAGSVRPFLTYSLSLSLFLWRLYKFWIDWPPKYYYCDIWPIYSHATHGALHPYVVSKI